jgi:hypothetical protein
MNPEVPADIRARLQTATTNPDGIVFSVSINALRLSRSKLYLAWLQSYVWCRDPQEELDCLEFRLLKVVETTSFKTILDKRLDDVDLLELNWSPDDRLIALRRNSVVSGGNTDAQTPTLWLADIVTGDIKEARHSFGASWCRNGNSVFSLSDQGFEEIVVIPHNGIEKHFTAIDFFGVQAFACSPNSPIVAIAAQSQEDTERQLRPIYSFDLDVSEVSILLKEFGRFAAFESPAWSTEGQYLATNAAYTAEDKPVSTVIVSAQGKAVREFSALLYDPQQISFVWSRSETRLLRQVDTDDGPILEILDLISGLSSRLEVPAMVRQQIDDNTHFIAMTTW